MHNGTVLKPAPNKCCIDGEAVTRIMASLWAAEAEDGLVSVIMETVYGLIMRK
jgi:hypothetical protein